MRTVVENPEVSARIDAETAIYPRLEAAFDALKWWLSHEPESGECLDDFHWLWKQSGNRDLKIPALVALYTFTPDEVELISILVRLPTL